MAALPKACRPLMIDPSSPIIDLYGSDAPIDPNGKHLPWLWILLLPFVDEKRIVSAFNENKSGLTVEECRRNAFGVSIMFLHLNHKLAVEAKSTIRYRPLEETDTDVLNALSKDNEMHDMTYVTENEESSADAPDSKGDATSDMTSDMPAPAALADMMLFDHPVGDGISGTLSAPPQKWFTLAGPSCTVKAPPTPAPIAFRDLAGNKVIILTFASPVEVPGSHKSELLPGVILDKSELTNFDLMPRKPPRLNRGGFNIVDLALGIRRGPNPNNILSYNGGGRGGDGQGHHPNQRQYNQGSQPQQFLQHFQNQQQQYNNNNNNNNNNYNQSYGYEMAHRNGDGRNGQYGGGRDDRDNSRNQYNDNGRHNNQNNFNNDSSRDQYSNNGPRSYNNQNNYQNQNQNQNHRQQNSGGNYSHQQPYAPPNNNNQYQLGNAYTAQVYPPQQTNTSNGRFSFSTTAGSNSGSSAVSAVSMDSMRAQLAKTLQQQGGRAPPQGPPPGPGSFSSMGRPDNGSQGQGQGQGQYGGRR